ncbi:uncharacterized protein LOC110842921 isoform X2 [Folsomia candida]|uniref:uncharacterized protein LOC110842921 isoform X2 n=1 Tax=Folsomia candida TaxID=158441 RepID=UPI000B8F43AA|nr:uncharacterized protein LOC110842921 isoform X2 [Folsomia candida]
MVWDSNLKICTLCNTSCKTAQNYGRHFSKVHDQSNPEECVVPDCGYRCKSARALNYHITKDHKTPGINAILEDGQCQIWAERLKLICTNEQVGMYVGLSKLYHAYRAANSHHGDTSRCAVMDFESEGLCKGDHRGARTLLIVTPDARKTGQTYPEFKRKFNEKIWAYKNFRSTYVLSTQQKEEIQEAILRSDFKDQHSKTPQRSIIYRDWRKSDVGRMARAETAGFRPLAKWEDKNENANEPIPDNLDELHKVLGNLDKLGRQAAREELDKLSQEEKIRDRRVPLAPKRVVEDDDDDDFRPTTPKKKSGGESSSFN